VTGKLRQKWLNAALRMQKVMAEIADTCPQYNLYVECETFHLMNGRSHDDGESGLGHPERSIESVRMRNTDCGAW
jgi:hypothetical protein